jgi:hypothetical protein
LPKVTPGLFDDLHRSAKSIQGATVAGVARDRFAELNQGLATELAIIEDRQLSELDKTLLAHYKEAFDAYRFSAEVWDKKIQRQRSRDGGDKPVVAVGDLVFKEIEAGAVKYDLPIEQEQTSEGVVIRVLPADAITRVWLKADASLAQAAQLLYGLQR